jgi:DNA-binding transcriptional LysR family regulator
MFNSERLKGIDVFVCVADVGSFTGAAERLNLTNSAVSKGIARLESRLGSKLFHRTTRQLSLTDAGKIFYRTCTGVLADLEEVELALNSEHAEPRGRVRIDVPASYGRLHVLPVILKYIELHPQLQPHISFSDRYIDLVEDSVDIVVRIGGPDIWPGTLEHKYLGSERLIFCASPFYLAKRGTPTTEAELEQHGCVLYGRADGLVNPLYFKGKQPREIERRFFPGHIAIGDGEGQVAAVLAGLGIAQLPLWLTNEHLRDGTLVEVLPHLATDGSQMNLVWPKSRQALAKVQAILEVFSLCLSPAGSEPTLIG